MNRSSRIRLVSVTLLTLLVLALSPVSAQDMLWSASYGGYYNEGGYSGARTVDGGCLVLGSTYSFGAGDHDFYLLCIDSLGDTLWSRTYGGAEADIGYDLCPSGDGGYFAVGSTRSFGAGQSDVYLLKIDFIGGLIWSKTYGGSEFETGLSVRATSDGGCIIAGSTSSYGAGSDDIYLIRTDSQGDTLWTRAYGGTAEDVANAVRPTPDGGFITSGFTGSFGAGYYSLYAIRTDANGDTLWSATYGGDQADIGYGVENTLDGGLVFVGVTANGGYYDTYLVKTDPTGGIEWERSYGGTQNDCGYSVRSTADGGYFIAGTTDSYGNGKIDMHVIKTNPLGITEWDNTYGGSQSDFCRAAVSDDGSYFLVGYSYSYAIGGSDIYLLKISAEGATDVEDDPTDWLPESFALAQNYPNPFNLTTTIEFSLERRANVTLTIHNILGQTVRQWPLGLVSSGLYSIDWNGLDAHGRETASGVYLYTLEYGTMRQTRKMILLK
ncbi:MAG: T9SS type A sorting domain-containing protein [candidate division Zixibacteria bacterium]|nr:T9SS type A sorting domain-containing protein [candidate division Zixibacteria bacterium]